MTEPTRSTLLLRLSRAAAAKKTDEAAWLVLEDENKTGDTGKEERDAAYATYKASQDLANRCAALLLRRDTREGLV